jgi:hypothetical protein
LSECEPRSGEALPLLPGRLLRGLGPLAVTVALSVPSFGSAQSSPWIRLGANGVLAYTTVDPVPGARSLGEIRLVQPTIMAHASALENRLRFLSTLNLEGLTIPEGELTPGAAGEGFVDRRHPHTYLHELMFTFDNVLGDAAARTRLSLSAGKGFVPFGTDDPMSRPVLRYPVNHHLAQILERAVAVVGLSVGPVMVEGGLFNGDEPERPGQWPRVSRFGDSWSGRLTIMPIRELELQSSHASVHSPEHRAGAGTDHSKWSVSGRWSGSLGRLPVYGLLEWARTSEAGGFFVFHSVLTEAAWTAGRSRVHYRFERTDRPEEERTSNLFRSRRPQLENSILGQTRWAIHTVGYSFHLEYQPARLDLWPLMELSLGSIRDTGAGLFDARSFYGKTSFWSLSLGARLNLGMGLHRMGRYGVAEDTAAMTGVAHHGRHEH